jgi:hypothetical protein
MVLENLEDLLTIDTDSNKAADNKNLLKKLKQIIKAQNHQEKEDNALAEDLPYTGVSVVGDKHITLKFDLESRKAVVEKIEEDPRKQNYMAAYHAKNILLQVSKEQK